MSRSSEIIEVEVTVKGRTTLALQVDDGKTTAWIPRSQIEDWSPDTENEFQIESIFIPEWLATEKGFT